MPTIAEYLKYANLQMAAEAFLNDPDTGDKNYSGTALKDALVRGNRHASKFTETEAIKFTAEWEVVDQLPNTTTGFSGTLFKNNQTGELVISFRSTEFVDDAIRDSAATNALEVFGTGWAFGQISDMEEWYKTLAVDGVPLSQRPFSVTGYSLGGHLATAFNLLHPGAAQQVVTFNGAGVGKLKEGHTLQGVLDYFNDLRANPTSIKSALGFTLTGLADFYDTLHQNLADNTWTAADAKAALAGQRTIYSETDRLIFDGETRPLDKALDAILTLQAEAERIENFTSGVTAGSTTDQPLKSVPTSEILAQTLDYRLAVYLASQRTSAELSIVSKTFGDPLLTNQWDLVGTETSEPWSAVANSGVHFGTDVDLFIEDQPLTRGDFVKDFIKGLTGGEINLLQDKYSLNNFADTHSLVLIVDSLKVQDALLKLVAPAQRASATDLLNDILRNASWRKAQSVLGTQGQAEGDVLENVVNALAALILGPQARADRLNGNPIGNTWWDTASTITGETTYGGRDALYAKLKQITDSPVFAALAGQLTLTPSTGNLAADARQNFGAYAALYSLSPFVLSGTNEVFATALADQTANSMYAEWNSDLELLTNPDPTRIYAISEEWLTDRAAFLTRKNWHNANNVLPNNPTLDLNRQRQPGEIHSPYELENSYYEDRASSYVIQQGPNLDNTRRIIFGDERDDVLGGGTNTDHLYGAAGADTLTGNAGADHLEGGADDDELNGGKHSDTLHGGTGNDTYVFTSGDGIDTIDDADGIGQIKVADTALTGGNQYGARQWISDDKRAIYSLTDEADGSQTLAIAIGGDRILVKHFADNDLGIDLAGPVPPAAVPADRTIDGDLSPTAYTATLAGGAAYGADWRNVAVTNTVYSYNEAGEITGIISQDVSYNKADDLGNLIGSLGGPNRDDNLNGSGGADLMRGHGGDDTLLGNGGADRIEAGIGDDMANGGENDDQLVGDDGSDILLGGTGKDTLHGGIEAPLDQIYDYGENADATGVKGDWLDAGSGDDVLIGERGNDVLLGAEGADVLFGGAGDDVLDGDGAGGNVTPDWTLVATRDTATHGVGWHWTNGGSFGEVAANAGGVDALYGGAGDDVMDGGVADDYLDGGSGNDFLFGSQGADVLIGAAGNDQMLGDNSANVPAEDGADYLDGGEGNDTLVLWLLESRRWRHGDGIESAAKQFNWRQAA